MKPLASGFEFPVVFLGARLQGLPSRMLKTPLTGTDLYSYLLPCHASTTRPVILTIALSSFSCILWVCLSVHHTSDIPIINLHKIHPLHSPYMSCRIQCKPIPHFHWVNLYHIYTPLRTHTIPSRWTVHAFQEIYCYSILFLLWLIKCTSFRVWPPKYTGLGLPLMMSQEEADS